MKYVFALLLVCHIQFTAFSQWMGFSVKQKIPVEHRLYNMTIAHTNGDDFRDVVAFPFDAFTTVQVFRGDETETLQTPQNFEKQELYRLLYAADVDNDGVDDLIISSYWGNGFRIYWGNGNGSYTEGNHYGLTGHGKNLVVEDMNNDGAKDIVAFSGGSGQPITLHLFFGTNSRQINAGGIFSSIVHTDTRITIVDKNQDGLKDVMVSSSFPWFVIFYQEQNGTYTPRYWPLDLDLNKPFTSEHFVADFNNDNRTDLLSFFFDEGFRLYEGLQDTLFSKEYHSIPTHSRLGKIFITDLNRDGKMDIVMENFTNEYEPTNSFYYLLGNGDFTFSEPTPFDVGAPIDRLIVGDLNGDEFPDVVVYSADKQLITVLNEGIVSGNEGQDFSFTAYPNPFNNVLRLEFDSYPARVTIFDIQGKIQTDFVATENKSLQTENWSDGLYVVSVNTGRKVNRFKVMKK